MATPKNEDEVYREYHVERILGSSTASWWLVSMLGCAAHAVVVKLVGGCAR